MAGMGKAYIPVEPGEVGKSVRKMIVNQFVRSAMVAWESRPRDLVGEVLQAEQTVFLPPETQSIGRNDYLVGREIPIDPSSPPWGDVQHLGWSSPAIKNNDEVPHLQFEPVIEELPNLIEARAVSVAPLDPTLTTGDGAPASDPVVVDLLRRPETMGMRDYLTQLSYLGLINPPEVGQSFLHQYENARFNGLPISEAEFKNLMTAFASLLSGMTELQREIIDQIRAQTTNKSGETDLDGRALDGNAIEMPLLDSPLPQSPYSSIISPVTARTALSRDVTPYLQQGLASENSLSSVIHQESKDESPREPHQQSRRSQDSSSLESLQSESGSVLRHSSSPENG